MTVVAVVIGIVVLALLVAVGYSIKIIREYQRIVLFRLGRAQGLRGPGLTFVNPVTDRVSWVDLRERFLEIPHQTAITSDNASISIDFIIFYKVVDPMASVLQVQNFAAAAQNVAATTLRSVVGEMVLDDVLSKREEMNASLRVRLDEVTERWGVKVTNVEVREINPPGGVLEAMTRQMSAERTRRALITEALGQKQSSITLAEGAKQAAVLNAEGERQSAVLRAEGLANGLEKIFDVGKGLDRNTMQLQYLEVLKQVGASPSTKIVVPMDLLGGLMKALGGADGPPTLGGVPEAAAGNGAAAAIAERDGRDAGDVAASGGDGEKLTASAPDDIDTPGDLDVTVDSDPRADPDPDPLADLDALADPDALSGQDSRDDGSADPPPTPSSD